jgi:hypothetical protein
MIATNVIHALSAFIGDGEDDEKENKTPEENEASSAVMLYAKGARSAMEQSLKKINSKEGFMDVIGSQVVGDIAFGATLFDPIKRVLTDYSVNGLYYHFGSNKVMQEDENGNYDVPIANDLLMLTLSEFLDSDGRLLEVYRGEGNWDFLAPFLVNFKEGLDALEVGSSKQMIVNGKVVDITDKEAEIMTISGWADIISAISPLQDFAQMQNTARRTNEKIMKGEWFDELAKKGDLNTASNLDLMKSWDKEMFRDKTVSASSKKLEKMKNKSFKNEGLKFANKRIEELRENQFKTLNRFRLNKLSPNKNKTQLSLETEQLKSIDEILSEYREFRKEED